MCSCSVLWYVIHCIIIYYCFTFCFETALKSLLPSRFVLGGVKLGAGGLIRAYGGAARLVLREAPKEVLIPRTSLRVCVLSQNAGAVYDAAAKVGGSANDEEYTAEGELVVTVTCDLEQENRLRQILADATRGNAEFLQLEDNVDS
jgi:putative IMPACT (imprinted ancient) family translation regulator